MAIVFPEPGHQRLLEMLGADSNPGIGTPTLAETGIVLAVRRS